MDNFRAERNEVGRTSAPFELRPPLGEVLPGLEARLRGLYVSFFLPVCVDGMTTEDLQGRALQLLTKSNGTIRTHTPDDLDDLGDLDELDQELKHADYEKDAEEVADPQHSDAETTVVQFTHARIRDYVLQEGIPEDIGIGVDANAAHIHISIICLLILSDDIPKVGGDAWESPDLADYAADNFLYHLWAIDRSRTRKTDSQQIARLLCSLFVNTESLMRWVYKTSDANAFLHNTIANKDFLAMLQAWLSMLDDISQYSNETQMWINEARTSKRTLLKPLAKFLSRCWLQDREMSECFCIMFLHAYSSLPVDGSRQGTESFRTWSVDQIVRLSVDDIVTGAKISELEEDSYWHGRLTKGFRVANHIDASVSEFHVALALNPEDFFAHYGLGAAYSLQKDYRSAINTTKRAIKDISNHKANDIVGAWDNILDWSLQMNDVEGAILAGRQSVALQPGELLPIWRLVDALDRGAQYKKGFDLMLCLDQEESGDSNEHTTLIELFFNYLMHDVLGKAAHALGKTHLLIEAF